jgi:hypothetical protein
MDDEKLRKRVIAGGLKTVSQTTWDRELDVVHKFVTRGERRFDAERGAQHRASQRSDVSAEGVK